MPANTFEAYLKCGRLEHGFLRVRCDKCHFERLVAFSCKKRGFCPSCGARRVAETAALLADEVFPNVALRQSVISFPFPLRYLFAAHPHAMGKVLGIIYRAISTHLIHKAGYRLKDGATGAVTLIQRFGSALNLNIHFHILFLDGAYVYRDNRPPRFQRVKAPRKCELEDLVQLISQRVGHCLERQGLLEQDAENAWLDPDPAQETDAMPHILDSSVSYRIAVGPQQGRKAFMIRTIRPLDRHPEDALPGRKDAWLEGIIGPGEEALEEMNRSGFVYGHSKRIEDYGMAFIAEDWVIENLPDRMKFLSFVGGYVHSLVLVQKAS